MSRADLSRVGKVYGRLLVTGYSRSSKSPSGKSHYTYWNCLCECGNITEVTSNNLNSMSVLSCGCLNSEQAKLWAETGLSLYRIRHNLSQHPLYDTWRLMKSRCSDPEDKDFHTYGGRGIKVCERWYTSLRNFIVDVGDRPEGMTLDRIDVNGDYCKENCRWASPRKQNLNTRYNLETPNVYEDNGKFRAFFQWRGVKYDLGTFESRETALKALSVKYEEIGWNDK